MQIFPHVFKRYKLMFQSAIVNNLINFKIIILSNSQTEDFDKAIG